MQLNHSELPPNRRTVPAGLAKASPLPAPPRDQPANFDWNAEFARVRPRLVTYATKLSRNKDVAEDVVQEAMLKAWMHRRSFAIGTSLDAWMTTIVHNEYLSHRRYEYVRRALDIDDEMVVTMDPSPPPDVVLISKDQLQLVRDHLAEMSDGMRGVVLLMADGFSQEDVASKMMISVGTVKSRCARGREMLQREAGRI